MLYVLLANINDKPHNLTVATDIVIENQYNEQRINYLQIDNKQRLRPTNLPSKPSPEHTKLPQRQTSSFHYNFPPLTDSIAKTGFSVENGHYEYVRLPFGLKKAPATFQRINVLKKLQKICTVQMNIIIFFTSLQEYINNIKQVLKKLQEAGLKIQLDKSEFLGKSVEFLGHVTHKDIKRNPRKIEAIRKFPIPTTKQIK